MKNSNDTIGNRTRDLPACTTRNYSHILIILQFSRFEKYSNIKFHENLSGENRAVPYGRTDRRFSQFYERA
jgi:hypothetical protein